jgi:hypothetical protein
VAPEYAIADTGFCEESGNNGSFSIKLYLTEIGAGKCNFAPGGCCEPYGASVSVTSVNASESQCTSFEKLNAYNSKCNFAYNLSGTSSKEQREGADELTLISSGISIALSAIPGVDTGITLIQASMAAGNLFCCFSDLPQSRASADETAQRSYFVDGGLRKDCQSFNNFIFGTVATINCQNYRNLRDSFGVCVDYKTCYCNVNCLNGGLATVMKQKITSAPASAIWGNVSSNACKDSFYVVNPSNGNSFRLITGNGHYYFYTRPDTSYNIYSRSPSGGLTLLYKDIGGNSGEFNDKQYNLN